jgi:AcrR family transcriptional regulator
MRVARTHNAVLTAAAELLVERGPAAFTVESVVARSGVALTTVYRHWPTRGDLLAAAIAKLDDAPPMPDTGSLRNDLLEFFTTRAQALEARARDKRLQTLPGLIELGQRDPVLADVVAHVLNGLSKALSLMLERGQARGEVRTDCDLDAMTDVLLGAVLVRRAYRGKEITEAYVTETVDALIKGMAPR